MKTSLVAALVLSFSCACAPAAEQGQLPASPIRVDHDGLKKLSWQTLCRSATFGDLTVLEMIDLMHANDFHHIELSPGQSVSPEHKDAKVGPELSPESLDAIAAKLKQVHMDIVSYDAGELGNSEAEARKVFELGQKLKVKNLLCDPSPDSLEMLDKLATEYKINVAILNGSVKRTTTYGGPDAFLKAIEGRSNRIGACADLAEWRRSGHIPAECIKKLGSRVIEVRLKDTNNQTEAADVADALKELKAQNYKGPFSVGTSRGSGQEAIQNLATVVNRFSDVVTKLAAVGE